jgi:1,4-alpha-glucan branching enzyme
MQMLNRTHPGALGRYSAKRTAMPINFYYAAPNAQSVCVAGDFNGWRPDTHPMSRQVDGSWSAQIPLSHGHHQYVFVVDGQVVLDPRAQGIARNSKNERVSMIAVS